MRVKVASAQNEYTNDNMQELKQNGMYPFFQKYHIKFLLLRLIECTGTCNDF